MKRNGITQENFGPTCCLSCATNIRRAPSFPSFRRGLRISNANGSMPICAIVLQGKYGKSHAKQLNWQRKHDTSKSPKHSQYHQLLLLRFGFLSPSGLTVTFDRTVFAFRYSRKTSDVRLYLSRYENQQKKTSSCIITMITSNIAETQYSRAKAMYRCKNCYFGCASPLQMKM